MGLTALTLPLSVASPFIPSVSIREIRRQISNRQIFEYCRKILKIRPNSVDCCHCALRLTSSPTKIHSKPTIFDLSSSYSWMHLFVWSDAICHTSHMFIERKYEAIPKDRQPKIHERSHLPNKVVSWSRTPWTPSTNNVANYKKSVDTQREHTTILF